MRPLQRPRRAGPWAAAPGAILAAPRSVGGAKLRQSPLAANRGLT